MTSRERVITVQTFECDTCQQEIEMPVDLPNTQYEEFLEENNWVRNGPDEEDHWICGDCYAEGQAEDETDF